MWYWYEVLFVFIFCEVLFKLVLRKQFNKVDAKLKDFIFKLFGNE